MKILFVTDRADIKNDVIGDLAKKLLPYLEKENEVLFLNHTFQKEKVSDLCFFYDKDEKVRELYFSLNKATPLHKILKLISKPHLSIRGFFKLLNVDFISGAYKRQIEKVAKKYSVDVIISLSAPFYTAKAVSKAKCGCKKIIYMFDPYADHHIYKNKITLYQEKNAVKKADKVITTKLLANNFKERYGGKSVCFEFPNLVFDEQKRKKPFDETKINILYVGSLYADIRSPEYLYELVKSLNDNSVHLTIAGGIYGAFSDEFNEKYNAFIKENVTLLGEISKQETYKYLQNADILVNIGNKIDNMLPSKVIELIAYGKPVLNIIQIKNCPSLAYFEKYGNALNLYSKNAVNSEIIEQMREFISRKKIVPKQEILEKFSDATPEYVAKKLLGIINGFY